MFNDFPTLTALPASNMDRAKAWYADKLDLKPVDERDVGVAYETTDGSRFFLYPSEFAGTNQATAIAFETGEKFDETVKFLRERGIKFLEFEMEGMTIKDGIVSAPDGMRGVWFKDSEGNIIGVSNMTL
jgi:catechol 2,3-dioxygenase-like lactoylglutathione lyase family enzyme